MCARTSADLKEKRGKKKSTPLPWPPRLLPNPTPRSSTSEAYYNIGSDPLGWYKGAFVLWIQLSLNNVSSALGAEKTVFGLSVLNNRFLLFIYYFHLLLFKRECILARNSPLAHTHAHAHKTVVDIEADENSMCCFVHLFAYLPTSAFTPLTTALFLWIS